MKAAHCPDDSQYCLQSMKSVVSLLTRAWKLPAVQSLLLSMVNGAVVVATVVVVVMVGSSSV